MAAGIDLPRAAGISPAGNTDEERHRVALYAASRAADQNGDQP